jgi:uncharacterized FAD-dependent dehydrogenase
MGLKPIILERGKVVRERTKDTWGFWRKRELNTESNVQFGEGGAGTFSDGKLWTQVKDPKHYGRKVLEEFVKAGAPEEILYVSKPHIGTFRLVKMVEHIRATTNRWAVNSAFNTRWLILCWRSNQRSRPGANAAHSRRGARQRRNAHCRSGHPRHRPQRATLSRCCMNAVSTSSRSRSRLAFASSIRRA